MYGRNNAFQREATEDVPEVLEISKMKIFWNQAKHVYTGREGVE